MPLFAPCVAGLLAFHIAPDAKGIERWEEASQTVIAKVISDPPQVQHTVGCFTPQQALCLMLDGSSYSFLMKPRRTRDQKDLYLIGPVGSRDPTVSSQKIRSLEEACPREVKVPTPPVQPPHVQPSR